MDLNLNHITNKFLLKGSIKSIYAFGSGHINDTYKVETTKKNYLLQKINHLIFKNVEGLTENLIAVSDFLEKRIKQNHDKMEFLRSIPTHQNDFIYKTQEGSYWRVFDFVENCTSYDRVLNADLAFQGGKTYGWFVKVLCEFPTHKLIDTIPDFHNARFRIESFKNAVDKDIKGRGGEIRGIIDFLLDRADSMMAIYELGKNGEIPIRVTHNDTKINNVLFDSNNQGYCVIDLDTVMPGYVHFDFGDAIRTFTNSCDEDEKNISKIEMNMEYFSSFSKGFLSQTREILNPTEISRLAFSAKYITYEQSIRFLTDFLQGDTYYKINFGDHNLVRATAQAQLLKSMEEKFHLMEEVISSNT